MVWLEVASVEHWMYLEPCRKLHLIGYISYPFKDGEQTLILANQSFMYFAKESELGWLELDQHHVAFHEV